jgi:hypothetical protein
MTAGYLEEPRIRPQTRAPLRRSKTADMEERGSARMVGRALRRRRDRPERSGYFPRATPLTTIKTLANRYGRAEFEIVGSVLAPSRSESSRAEVGGPLHVR